MPAAARDLERLEALAACLGTSWPLRSRAMFGGHGVYAGDTFFAIVHRGRVYFRVDAALREDWKRQGSAPFRPRAGQVLGSYWEVPGGAWKDPARLRVYAKRAVAAAPARRAKRGQGSGRGGSRGGGAKNPEDPPGTA